MQIVGILLLQQRNKELQGVRQENLQFTQVYNNGTPSLHGANRTHLLLHELPGRAVTSN